MLIDLTIPGGTGGPDGIRMLRDSGRSFAAVLTSGYADSPVVKDFRAFGFASCLTKPFSVRELTARIKARLRRRRAFDGELETFDEGGIHIDFAGQQMTVGGEAKELSSREFHLLRHLIQNRGRVLSRDQILNKVWGYEYDGTPRTIDNFINKLRQKLGDDPVNPRWIQTVRGSGYKFRA